MHVQRNYAELLNSLPFHALRHIHDHLRLPPDPFLDDPYGTLARHALLPVDAVVALASSPDPEARSALSTLLGHPVTVCPPCLSRYREEFHPTHPSARARHPDDRRVLHVDRNPRLPTTPAFDRFRILRPGMSLRTYLTRVGTERGRRDIRAWVAEGSVVLEEAA
jgi:hypothetical protein